jgi:hypothetical protein
MKREVRWTLSTGKEAKVTIELVIKKTIDADGHKVTVPCCDLMIAAEVEGMGVVGYGHPQKAQTAPAKIGRLAISQENLGLINAAISEIEAMPEWQAKVAGEQKVAEHDAVYETHRAKMRKVMGY